MPAASRLHALLGVGFLICLRSLADWVSLGWPLLLHQQQKTARRLWTWQLGESQTFTPSLISVFQTSYPIFSIIPPRQPVVVLHNLSNPCAALGQYRTTSMNVWWTLSVVVEEAELPSADGYWLVATLTVGCHVTVYRVHKWELLHDIRSAIPSIASLN